MAMMNQNSLVFPESVLVESENPRTCFSENYFMSDRPGPDVKHDTETLTVSSD